MIFDPARSRGFPPQLNVALARINTNPVHSLCRFAFAPINSLPPPRVALASRPSLQLPLFSSKSADSIPSGFPSRSHSQPSLIADQTNPAVRSPRPQVTHKFSSSSPAMAEPAPAPAQPRTGGDDVISARLQRALELLFPSNLAGKAVLFAVVVALLRMLPTSQTPGIWDLPHILLLGLVISYGVFGQRNADADVVPPVVPSSKVVDDDESVEAFVSQILQGPLVFEGSNGDGGAKDGGVQAWSSQYYPDDALVVVADTGDAGEKPILLPVRKLKPLAEESAPGNVSDGATDEEAEFLPKEEIGYGGAREKAMSSPSSVLDAGLTLSPSSPPPPPPAPQFLGSARGLGKARARSFNEYGVGDMSMSGRAGLRSRFRSNSSIQATRRSTLTGYDPVAPSDDQAAADDEADEMAAASDSSFSSDDMARDGDDEHDEEEDNYDEEGEGEEEGREGDNSCDEELFELATRAEAEEDEVDKKADEFIAKFREQIRMQRAQPGPGRR
ncbi:hypothetical protein VPH35_022919 [Triticum aestivum]|uniref:uncharacterized protein n=1 Tax=Triticum aestivum TaxID=4565 RepID=UPI000843929B|nr:uncharacterized protein LOC123185885 [Triticum aestivum]